MRTYGFMFAAIVFVCAGCGSSASTATAGASGYAAVQAIFTSNCVRCHGGDNPKAGIDLGSYESVMKGGRQGPIVTPGDPAGSVVVQAPHGENGKKPMPMRQPPLAGDQIKTIEDWIKAGAKRG